MQYCIVKPRIITQGLYTDFENTKLFCGMENVLSSGYPMWLHKTQCDSERWCILSTWNTSNDVTFTKHMVYIWNFVRILPRKTFSIRVRLFFWIQITNFIWSTANCRLSTALSQQCLTHLTLIPEVPTTTVSTLFPIVFPKHETAQCKPRGCVVPYLCELELHPNIF